MTDLAASSRLGTGGARTSTRYPSTKYSREEAVGSNSIKYADALEQCFGPRPHGMPTDPVAARRPYEAYFLPDAYKGRSDYLLTTLIDAVVSGNSFVTGKCLPLLQHDNPEITWSTMSFDNSFVDYEPEQGVPRLLTQRSATFQDHMARRGIAFVVNHGFANTEGGRLDFFYKLAHMKHVLQETLDQDGLIQIINCKNDYAMVSNGYKDAFERQDGDAMRACERTIDNFACVQKGTGRGWVTLDESIKAEMARNGVQPDTWIVPPGMKSFAALEEASVEYYRAGPIASQNIERGGKQNDTFRGCEVNTCNSYRLDNAEVDINPFVRDRVLGDYFVVRNWADGRVNRPRDEDARGLFDQMAGKTYVYCCETDKWELFDLAKMAGEYYENVLSDQGAMKLALAKDKEYHDADEENRKKSLIGMLIERMSGFSDQEFADELKYIFGSKEGFVWACTGKFPEIMSGSSEEAKKLKETLDRIARERDAALNAQKDGEREAQKGDGGSGMGGISPPAGMEDRHMSPIFSLLCVRPFRRYRMGSAVLMATGLDTGFTAHAHEDVQVGDDPISHVHVTHFTGWFSSTIIDTKRVAVAHDVFCMGYQAGEGKKTVALKDWKNKHPYQFMFESGEDKGSIFVMLAPGGYGKPSATDENDIPKNPIDLSGQDTALPCGGVHKAPFHIFNDSIWGFSQWNSTSAQGADFVEEASKFSADPFVNMLCFQTMQKVISSNGTENFEFGAYIRNTDHFGADHIGPGSRSSRNGGFSALKTFNYDSLKVL